MAGLTYDTGALIAAERSDRRIWALHRRALERGIVPTVPAGVVGQGWRDGPQAQMPRLLAGCRIEVLDEARARSAGAACRASGSADIVDASVVVGAAARGDLVVTSDPADLSVLTAVLRVDLEIEAI
ncbi:MAG: twitching motility protein PilT [Acidimicrobiia bacterium]